MSVPDPCDLCGQFGSFETSPVDFYWATAHVLGITPGNYHLSCAESLAARHHPDDCKVRNFEVELGGRVTLGLDLENATEVVHTFLTIWHRFQNARHRAELKALRLGGFTIAGVEVEGRQCAMVWPINPEDDPW